MIVGAVATVVGGAVAVGLAGGALHKESQTPSPLKETKLVATVRGTANTPQGVLPHAFLNLTTWPDSLQGIHGPDGGAQPDWVTYGPTTNLSVPAHSVVTITVKQYDGGEEINNPYFAKVHGTIDGTETFNGRRITEWDPLHIGHTFTIHMFPQSGQDQMFVSVPLPAVPDEAPLLANGYPAPYVVTFSFITKGPGRYIWQCEFPCGDGYYAKFGGPMGAEGYMAGTLDVTPTPTA
jgi:hypothetical protein